MNYSRRNPKRSAKCVYHTGTLASSIARAGTSCLKEEGKIRNSSIIRWTFFQFPSTSSRKDDLTDTDVGNFQETGDKEYHTANQLKKKCKKNISKESMIDSHEIQNSVMVNGMIDNNRDEELCRKGDALADEDHTHHLTPQEYSLYKSNWWLHSNKQGSNTVRTTYRSDFKKALSTLQQLKQKEEGALQ